MSNKDSVVITYIRANPPTKAHELVYNRIVGIPNADHYVFVSSKSGDPKNPLTPVEKLPFLKKMFKAANVEIVAGGFIEGIKKVSPRKNLYIVVGGDRAGPIEMLANKYNHKLYDFDNIEIVNAGSRTANPLSATKMRQWAVDQDKDSFFKGASDKLSDQDKQKLYDLVRNHLVK